MADLQEDERLKLAVKEYGNERIDWKEVQQRFKLRAAKSCRLRWNPDGGYLTGYSCFIRVLHLAKL